MRKYRTTLDYKASAFRQASVPSAAIKGEAYKKFLLALDKYDVNSGVQFKTFLENSVRLNRFVNSNKNMARIPEHKFLKITRFKTSRDALEGMLGRMPTGSEIADRLGQSTKWVGGMEKSLKRYQLTTSESHERGFSLGDALGDRWRETKEMIYFQLDPLEKKIFDLTEGAHGKKRTRSEDIAKKLKITMDRVYTVRGKIDRMFQTHH